MKTIITLFRKFKQMIMTLPFVFLFISSKAQVADSSQLTIDRLFDDVLSAKSFGPVKWLEGKSAYTILEEAKEYYKGRMEIVSYDTKTGERNVMIPAWRLIPPGNSSPINVESYTFTKNYSHALIYTNTRIQESGGTTGDYWILDLLLWDWYKLGKEMPGQCAKKCRILSGWKNGELHI